MKLSFPVQNPEKWTAETPKLYTTVLTLTSGNKVVETISSKTGFREVEIRGGYSLQMGYLLSLKGLTATKTGLM